MLLRPEREDDMTRYDKILIFLIIAAAVFGIYYTTMIMDSRHGNYAIVMVDGKEHSRIELEGASPREFTVASSRGYNTIEVGNNRIRIKDSTCPDKICVKEGWISRVNQMTVCMPNRVYIKIVGQDTEIDDIAY